MHIQAHATTCMQVCKVMQHWSKGIVGAISKKFSTLLSHITFPWLADIRKTTWRGINASACIRVCLVMRHRWKGTADTISKILLLHPLFSMTTHHQTALQENNFNNLGFAWWCEGEERNCWRNSISNQIASPCPHTVRDSSRETISRGSVCMDVSLHGDATQVQRNVHNFKLLSWIASHTVGQIQETVPCGNKDLTIRLNRLILWPHTIRQFYHKTISREYHWMDVSLHGDATGSKGTQFQPAFTNHFSLITHHRETIFKDPTNSGLHGDAKKEKGN